MKSKKKHKKKNVKKNTWTREEKILCAMAIALGILLIGLYYSVYVAPSNISVPKQPSVKIIELTADCEDCLDVSALYNQIVSDGGYLVESTDSISYNSEEGKKLIEKYGIQQVPAFIIESKNLEDLSIDPKILTINGDFAVFDKAVPYVDLNTNEVVGKVKFVEIQPTNCANCASLQSLLSSFESLGIKTSDYKVLNEDSPEGKALVSSNGLLFAPTLLVSKDIEQYWWAFDNIKQALVEKDDYYHLNIPLAPFIDLNSQEMKGVVGAIYLVNGSCTDCFSVADLGNSLKGVGIYFGSEKTIDISSNEGKTLLNKYSITAVPTVILSKEVNDYPQLKEVLAQIGSIESDGVFVFRKLEATNAKYQEIK